MRSKLIDNLQLIMWDLVTYVHVINAMVSIFFLKLIITSFFQAVKAMLMVKESGTKFRLHYHNREMFIQNVLSVYKEIEDVIDEFNELSSIDFTVEILECGMQILFCVYDYASHREYVFWVEFTVGLILIVVYVENFFTISYEATNMMNAGYVQFMRSWRIWPPKRDLVKP